MKYNAEEYFVNNYIIKEKRGRLLFELNGKKRRDGIGRFCHGADEILIGKKIILSGKLLFDEIKNTLEKYDKDAFWYIIAYDKNIDRKCVRLDEALDLVLGNGMAAVMLSGNTAFVETEQCEGTPVRYILRSSER